MDIDSILARAAAAPDDVSARIAAAYACDRVGREEDAIGHYDAAWDLGVPEEHRRHFLVGYGSTLRNVGRFEDAITRLGEALAVDPGYAPFKVFLGLALHSQGEHDAAVALLMDAVLDVHGGARLDGYERAIASYQRVLLERSISK